MKILNDMHFSPSDVHQHLMATAIAALAYDGGDVNQWQGRLRPKLGQLLGCDNLPRERCDLNPRVLWRREHPLGTIEKVVFSSEPKSHVPAYLCLPGKARPPYPCMIALQGHNSGMHHAIGVKREDETIPMAVEGDRDFGLQCMKHGFAALCIEQRSFGERREQKVAVANRTMCHEAAVHALMLGRTLIGERVYDVDRGLDYLASREEVDMGSVGIMGNSGGGTISLFSAAMLPRLSLAAPGSYFCTFGASIMSLYHCTCNYVPGLYNVADMADILGLFAPKPVVIVNGKDDEIFPIEATRQAFKALKRIYEACGAGDHCHLVVGDEGHRYYADQAWPLILESLRGSGARTEA